MLRGIDWVVWCDLETSGTDEDRHDLLEIALAAARVENPCLFTSVFSSLVLPGDGVDAAVGRMPKVVVDMHSGNGLIEALRDAESRGDVLDARAVEVRALAWLDDLGVVSHRAALAGSGVSHFDRRWLTRFMPELSQRFKYWHLDVGVMRRFLQLAGCDARIKAGTSGKAHRAFDDIVDHADEAMVYLRMLREVAEADAAKAVKTSEVTP